MVTNAEQFKHELEAMNEMSGPVFKVTNDPRVTPIGKFLRKYSLDELPQLLQRAPHRNEPGRSAPVAGGRGETF